MVSVLRARYRFGGGGDYLFVFSFVVVQSQNKFAPPETRATMMSRPLVFYRVAPFLLSLSLSLSSALLHSN